MIVIKNKVFIKLKVPEIDKDFDIYLPVNKKIGNIIILLNEAVSELSNGEIEINENSRLFNERTLETYTPDILLLNTNIRNGTVLVLTK